jgi:uncharacterized protein YdeI (YjbR/CyaY-like superfamily)
VSRPKAKMLPIPAAMKQALAADAAAQAAFQKLPPSHKTEHIKWIAGAKQPATARRRVEKLIPMLLAKTSAKAA